MSFVLTLIGYELFAEMMITMFGSDGFITSPFWFVAEGVTFGLIIDYAATHLGGDGEAIINSLSRIDY